MGYKRILSAVICTAMLFTSHGFTINALGAENQEISVMDEELYAPSPAPAPSAEEEGDSNDSQLDSADGQEEAESPVPEEIHFKEEIPKEESQITFGETDLQIMTETSLFTVDETGVLQYADGKGTDQIINNTVITIPKEAKFIPDHIFSDTGGKLYRIVFEEGSLLEEIETGAFKSSGITGISLPNNPLVLGDSTFKFCERLETISFGGVTSIGEECFLGCTALNSLVLGKDIKVIKENAFSGCTQIANLSLNNTETIGKNAFSGLNALTAIIWSSKITNISDYAFKDCTKLTSIGNMAVITESTLTLGRGIFSGCSALNGSVSQLPTQMSTMPQDMFKDCSKLTGITIPEGVTSIEAGAFSGCSGLTSIIIPQNVMHIRSGAYALCNGLTSITIEQIDNARNQSTITIAKEAFPLKTGIRMYGFDGTVEEYAEMRGYTFVTSFGTYNIANKESFSNGTIKVSEFKDIKKGKAVKIYVTPNTSYRIKSGTVIGTGKDKPNADIDFIGIEGTTAVFSMNMPAYDVVLSATFESMAKVDYGKLGYSFESVAEYIPVLNNGKEEFDQTGRSAKLKITSDQTQVGSWEFTYSSDNTKVAVISDTGIVTARSKGNCTIKAVLAGKPSMVIRIPVVVGSETQINEIQLNYSKLNRARRTEDQTLGMAVIQLNKESLLSGNRIFDVQLTAMDEDQKKYMVSSIWEVVDTGIATVEKSTTYDNQNTITVKKGAVGETTVTVTVLDKEGKKTDLSDTFIVRIVDATPRLMEGKLTVNVLSTVGTPFKLVSVYEYKVEKTSQLKVYEKIIKDGITTYKLSELFEIDDSHIKIIDSKASEIGPVAVTYTNLVIGGDFEDDYGDFYVAIPSLTLTQKALAPTVKLTGSINMFYTKDAPEQGTVQLTQSIKDVKVDGYALLSDEKNDPEGIFVKNFEINPDGLITRSQEVLGQNNGKDVVSGYVQITYKGYSEKITKAIKVPTVTKTPDYVLSATKATANSYAKDQEYKLQLIGKRNKDVLDILDTAEIFIDNTNSGTTGGLFRSITPDASNDVINIKINGTPGKGKAVFSIQQPTWATPLKYTFSLSVTDKLPKVKLDRSKLSLNHLLKGQIESTRITLNQVNDAVLLKINHFQYTGAAEAEANKIQISHNQSNGTISARIAAGQTVAPGTYSFEFTPNVDFWGANGKQPLPKVK